MVIKKQETADRGQARNYHPFPKYLQIRDVILRWLSTQKIGERLPTEMTLAAQFGVSRETIRKSLRRLEQGGIIRRRQRAGTFLLKQPAMSSDQRLTGPIEEFEELGTATTAKLVKQGPIAAPADVANALAVADGAQVYEFKRIRFLRGKPLLVLDAYFPLKIGEKIALRDLDGELIVPAVREILKSPLREEYQEIDALVATGSLAKQLGVAAGAPVLSVKRLFVDAMGAPAVLFRENFRSDRYFYTIKLPQG
jgi:GntR family transcriptional regulator